MSWVMSMGEGQDQSSRLRLGFDACSPVGLRSWSHDPAARRIGGEPQPPWCVKVSQHFTKGCCVSIDHDLDNRVFALKTMLWAIASVLDIQVLHANGRQGRRTKTKQR